VLANKSWVRLFGGVALAVGVSSVAKAQFAHTYLQAGHSVTSGDLNGDGYDELIVGVPATSTVYIYNGGTNTLLRTITGEAVSDGFGFSVASGMDTTGDGIDDLIIGAPYWAGFRGRVYQYSGLHVATSISNPQAQWSSDGGLACRYGYAVALIGDMDADDCAEFIASSPMADYGQGGNTGRAFLFSGRTNALANTLISPTTGVNFGYGLSGIGDFNGDGKPDFMVSSPYASYTGTWSGSVWIFTSMGQSPTTALRIDGSAAGDHFGWSASGAGDINYDGTSDVIVGCPGALSGRGKVFVFGNGGVSIYQHSGTSGGEGVGRLVAGVGDITGDGIADAAIVGNLAGLTKFLHGSYGGTPFLGSQIAISTQNSVTNIASSDTNNDGVREVLSAGLGGFGTIHSLLTGTNVSVPVNPANFVASDSECGHIELTWRPLANTGGYVVRRNSTIIALLPEQTRAYRDLPAPGTYAYEVTAWNYRGFGPGSLNSGTRVGAYCGIQQAVVSAKSNIFYAGASKALALPGGAGVLPTGISVPPVDGAIVTINSATGWVSPFPYVSSNTSAEGKDYDGIVYTHLSGLSPISGIRHERTMFLCGVFLSDNAPAGSQPQTINFGSSGIGWTFTDLWPELQQVFFIGDGLTGAGVGALQRFHAPLGARRLYLGFSDGNGFIGAPGYYNDNLGQLNVSIAIQNPGPIPYGTGKLNSLSRRAVLGFSGAPSVSQNNFSVNLTDAIPSTQAVLGFGYSPANIPFLGGTMLISNGIQRLPPMLLDAAGARNFPIAMALGMSGSTRYYQVFYRDPMHPDGSGMATSAGLQVTFTP
jgi:hypothetical protein